MVAKISVGEAPDLIKLAKTEHLTPIEERIKDLHESMNARQHAHADPLCSCCPLLPPAAPCCPLLPPGQLRGGAGASPSRASR